MSLVTKPERKRPSMQQKKINRVAELLLKSKRVIAFTGAGISAESGIPTYRGKGGVWENSNTKALELDTFMKKPAEAWVDIRNKFYVYHDKCKPNSAHNSLVALEQLGLLHTIITQNIDHLHQEAGSKKVLEFHGTMHSLTCVGCGKESLANEVNLEAEVPRCPFCDSFKNFLKPNFVFFGEDIPDTTFIRTMKAAAECELCFVIGTSGKVVPASTIPLVAKHNGATVVEINIEPSEYTDETTDIFFQTKASEALQAILAAVAERY